MVMKLYRRRAGGGTIETLYGVIVAQARLPVFYVEYGVPDTLEGRFDMIVLHLSLVIRRLRSDGEEGRAAAQSLFDRFCLDMDHNLREMGLSDMAVPRRMRSFGEAFYGRASAYDRALDNVSDGGQLAEAVGRNVFGDPEHAGAAPLATYMRGMDDLLGRVAGTELLSAQFRFPEVRSGTEPVGRG